MSINQSKSSKSSIVNRQSSIPYDAIIIGSGATGGWAAKDLCEAGLNVAVIEAGRKLDPEKDFTEHKWPFDLPFRGFGQPGVIAREQVSSVTVATEYNRHMYVLDKEHPYTTPPDKPFDWVRSRQVGGRSIVWGRQSYRLSDYDFKAASHDGYGEDWPIGYKDLAPYYDRVEGFIGISGRAENLPQLPDGRFLPPMNLTCAEQILKKAVDGFGDRKLTIGRTAILTQNHMGRAKCHWCGHCSRGCTTGSYYSSPASTLPAAEATGRMTLITNAVASHIVVDNNGKARGVHYFDRETQASREVFGKVILVCAATLESTRLLLNSKSRFHPAGLGNSHDVLGRYLMDHTIRVGAGGILSLGRGAVTSWDDGRANGIYIPRFRNLTTRRKDYIRGWGYQGSGTRGMFPAHARSTSGFGSEFKKAVKNNWPYSVGIGGWGEMLARRENFVTLSKEVRDRWGIPALHIDCTHSDNELKMAVDILESAKEMLRTAGVEITYENAKLAAPGVCIHEMGTCRMGSDPRTSMLNSWNQMWEVKNVFVTDGSSFTSSGCVNPTLTMMALTARACARIVDELRRGNI
jgi:choline dehydrogenase-like flavoprotein